MLGTGSTFAAAIPSWPFSSVPGFSSILGTGSTFAAAIPSWPFPSGLRFSGALGTESTFAGAISSWSFAGEVLEGGKGILNSRGVSCRDDGSMVSSGASVKVDGSGGSRNIVEARATSCQHGGLDFGVQ